MATSDAALSVREARDRYFADNGLGDVSHSRLIPISDTSQDRCPIGVCDGLRRVDTRFMHGSSPYHFAAPQSNHLSHLLFPS